MKVLVIGGSGFVSGTVARAAQARGWQVEVVTRGRRPVPSGVVALVADREDLAAFAQTIEAAGGPWDLVVDCIGYQPEAAQQDVAVFRTRAAHLVFISTDFVYHPLRRSFPQGEESDHYLSEGYGGLKRRCEEVLLRADCSRMQWTVLRPCHIYGPGSHLGCLPAASRDAHLLDKLRAGEAIELVGGGHFLQQPLLARDLAETVLSAPGVAAAAGVICNVAGPDVVESRTYYQLVADLIGAPLQVAELAVDRYRREHPEQASFLCHRVNDLTRLRQAGLVVPSTPLAVGLKEHVDSLR